MTISMSSYISSVSLARDTIGETVRSPIHAQMSSNQTGSFVYDTPERKSNEFQ